MAYRIKKLFAAIITLCVSFALLGGCGKAAQSSVSSSSDAEGALGELILDSEGESNYLFAKDRKAYLFDPQTKTLSMIADITGAYEESDIYIRLCQSDGSLYFAVDYLKHYEGGDNCDYHFFKTAFGSGMNEELSFASGYYFLTNVLGEKVYYGNYDRIFSYDQATAVNTEVAAFYDGEKPTGAYVFNENNMFVQTTGGLYRIEDSGIELVHEMSRSEYYYLMLLYDGCLYGSK